MLSNAFLLNRNHRSYIQTGQGKLATIHWYDMLLVFGIILLGVGLLRIDLTQNAIRDQQVLRDRGFVQTYSVDRISHNQTLLWGTKTTVTFSENTSQRSFMGSRSTYDYSPEYGANGQEIVQVVVDPENVALMDLQSALGFPFREVALTLFAVIVGSGLSVYGARQLFYRWQLSRRGELIAGHIVDVMKIRGENRLIFNIDYTFPAPDGQRLLHGKSTHIRTTLENRPLPQIGMPVAVLYLDEQHHQAL
ncbi:MAG: hypothetical protein RLP44_00980 [Aggregatilineales bacterium]